MLLEVEHSLTEALTIVAPSSDETFRDINKKTTVLTGSCTDQHGGGHVLLVSRLQVIPRITHKTLFTV